MTFTDTLNYEKDCTARLLSIYPSIRLATTKEEQLAGIDAYIGDQPIDFKFGKFFLENTQKTDEGWCTRKHNPNILIWFIPDGYCFFLGDLVLAKEKALAYPNIYPPTKTWSGGSGWWKNQLTPWIWNTLKRQECLPLTKEQKEYILGKKTKIQ